MDELADKPRACSIQHRVPHSHVRSRADPGLFHTRLERPFLGGQIPSFQLVIGLYPDTDCIGIRTEPV